MTTKLRNDVLDRSDRRRLLTSTQFINSAITGTFGEAGQISVGREKVKVERPPGAPTGRVGSYPPRKARSSHTTKNFRPRDGRILTPITSEDMRTGADR
ncbi:hypothetical protein EVAR_13017_1 [Eumeta japonica]|uniref:Uncharacterized protein n=1 Tax=Eumeta variegata TaxID=151549 RepID=A0A4C1TY79_EUMVA|nr:hypothetical protein EVAR_13017_1 [Eumeta japonica]